MCGSCCRMSPVSILPHEEVILRSVAEELGVDVKFTHGYLVYEAYSGVNLAFSYVMLLNNNRCPFLEGNLCKIHYIYKPYICRSFPYIPRHVKYHIDEENRYIMATTDYGLSLACPVVKRDKPALERAEAKFGGPIEKILIHYYKDGYNAAVEADNVRSLMLTLLSKLWRDGFVEIKPAKSTAAVVNLYEFLRKFYPDLPSVLGLDKVASRLRTWIETL